MEVEYQVTHAGTETYISDVRKTSCLEEVARQLPAGKPLHEWPSKGIHGFNEYDKKWYYCDCLHIIGLMIFFVILVGFNNLVYIIVYIVYVSKGGYIFFIFLAIYLFELSGPVLVMMIFQQIKPSLCDTLSIFLVICMILEILVGIFWFVIFIVVVSKNEEDMEKGLGIKFTWQVLLHAIYCFGFAVFYFFVRVWNQRFHEYVSEKSRVRLKLLKREVTGSSSSKKSNK